MRRSRDELTIDIERMIELRNQNKTYRQIAQIMGYKSPGTVSDLLRRRGHYSLVLNQVEISLLVEILSRVQGLTRSKTVKGIIEKLKKTGEKT